MKALVTAGGRATRMRPITHTTNKHLIPLANKPMLAHAVGKIVDAGIRDIVVNVNPGETDIQKVIGDGSAWDARITYVEQVGGPRGLAHIVRNARPYLGEEPFLFFLGDNIILGSIREFVHAFEEQHLDCMLALARVKDPQRFGVPVIEGDRIVRVVEKPETPPSDFAVTGIYVYSPRIFDAVTAITPSARGEYEISDAHTWLIDNGAKVGWREITGWWKDTGKPEDLLEGNALILNELLPEDMIIEGAVHPEARIQGRVAIGKGTTIGPGCLIRGPVTIGAGSTVTDAFIGPHTSIGDGATIAQTEIEHSIVLDRATVRCGCRIVDAIIGKDASVTPADETLPKGHRLIIGDNSVVEL
ncbi:glucose-1-phosphate thymidylyltransferase [Patescibacteria group bacterium]|nr:glucose-1-phosphate thymidylyltransferase [Patescibacteria group bacterium]MBU1448240.1 glucose-1-phosphate thymidylyltransferase [Patescibacteria group bacterium]MBU2613494.1 glucose-1-phosphate thymidylyltransferase [Patescibacteria group bacterium]